MLSRVNRVLLDINTANMFVTMVYGVLNLETLQFDYARAGHPAPLVVREKHELIEPQNQHAQPLALFTPLPLDVQQIQLQNSDTLLLYTDGITDAINEQNQEFGENGLRATLVNVCNQFEKPACHHLVHVLDEFRRSASQNDDITMVMLNVL